MADFAEFASSTSNPNDSSICLRTLLADSESSTSRTRIPSIDAGRFLSLLSLESWPNTASKKNLLPSPSLLDKPRFPPISSTNLREIVRPKPVPPYFLVVEMSACWNAENRFTGWVDIDLSEKGILEAEKSGQLIKNLKRDFKWLINSDDEKPHFDKKKLKQKLELEKNLSELTKDIKNFYN